MVREFFHKNISDQVILSKQNIFDLFEKLLDIYGINNIELKETDLDIYARFLYDNIILLNPDKIIKLCNLEINNHKNINTSNKIKYINYKIMQILIHEIQHIIQYKEQNEFLRLCNIKEQNYKMKKQYEKREYLCNPLERIAEIYSNDIIFNSLDKCDEIKDIFNANTYKCKLFGYFNDSYEYPLNYFFEENVPPNDLNCDKIIVGDKISDGIYNETLCKYLEIRR